MEVDEGFLLSSDVDFQQLAEHHQGLKLNRVDHGKALLRANRCPCCQNPCNEAVRPYPLCQSMAQVESVGLGIVMFFTLSAYYLYLASVAVVVAVVFYVTNFFLAQRFPGVRELIQAFMQLTAALTSLLLVFMLRSHLNNIEVSATKLQKSPELYTLLVKGLPRHATDNDIARFLQSRVGRAPLRINRCFDTARLDFLNRLLDAALCALKVTDFQLEKRMSRNKRKLLGVRQKIIRLEIEDFKELRDRETANSNRYLRMAFITFQYEIDARAALRNISRQARCRLCKSNKKFTMKGEKGEDLVFKLTAEPAGGSQRGF